LQREAEQDAVFATERLLIETKSSMTDLVARVTAELQQKRITNWDEAGDNLGACDTLALSEQLRPHESHLRFLSDAKDRLDIRLEAARIASRTATVELKKVEYLEAQLLCAISVLETEVLLAPVREKVGGVLAFSVRSQQLQAAAAEKKRELGLAESALRDEVTRQRTIAEHAMATGAVTRAQLATVVS
jgi:hypothetical protein